MAAALAFLLSAGLLFSAAPAPRANPAQSHDAAASDPRLQGSYRFEEGGWIYVHLGGSPEKIGYQHGYLLADEIRDAVAAVSLDSTYRTKRDWAFFRETAEKILWPQIDEEYRQELSAIAAGVNARSPQKTPVDVWDIVALNAFEEVPDYYVPVLNAREHRPNPPLARRGPERF